MARSFALLAPYTLSHSHLLLPCPIMGGGAYRSPLDDSIPELLFCVIHQNAILIRLKIEIESKLER